MAREYSLTLSNATVGAASLIAFQAGGSAPAPAIEVIRAWCSQSANATSNQQRVSIVTQVSTFPTVTSTTPVALKASDPVSKLVGGTAVAAGTCGTNASAEGAGGKTTLYPDAFNVLNGWLWVPTPNETIIETPQATAHSFAIYFPQAPTTTTNWNAGIIYREVG